MKFNVYSKEKHTKYVLGKVEYFWLLTLLGGAMSFYFIFSIFVNTVTSMPNISKSVWGSRGSPV